MAHPAGTVPENKEVYNYAHIQEDQNAIKFGSFRPAFVGKPPNYYPNTLGTYLKAAAGIIFVLLVAFGIFCALLVPSLQNSRDTAWVFSGVFALYILIILIVVFIGGRERVKKEKELIEKKIREQQKK
eukprot:TRINITY_DN182_c0_g1_i1.p1 TRINITY_DN182_c0_g1~~TRINITY_DN182_c0_g1_i1.p1  ORF type:complete len:128 (+),score=37.95 TRINITY_DN182_c0_g1_i1:137-520(+)